MDKYLLHKIIQFLIIGAVVGSIIFFGIGCYQWGKNSPERQNELQMPTIQGNSLLPIPQIKEEIIYARITAYNSVPEQTDSTPFLMASGNLVYNGAVACPTYLPLGSFIEIEGKVYRCEDRTHPRNDGTFDVWTETIEEAVAWGSSIREITLLTF